MKQQENNVRFTSRVGYKARWQWAFLLPKYWFIWLGILALLLLAFTPFRLRDKLAAKIGKIVAKKAKKQRHRARVNLQYCFPDWTENRREEVIDEMFVVVSQVMLGIGEIALRSRKYLKQRTEFIGLNHIYQAREEGHNIILMMPHSWAIDAAGVMLHSYGLPMTGIYNPHRNPLVDWLWTKTRQRFGTEELHARQNGIKPFLTSIKKGEMGCYLPDEDYGEALSEYADFFATYKATLPGLNKMAKVTKSVVIPMFSRYHAKRGKYEVEIRPPIALSDDNAQMARTMNEEIEYFVTPTPEQYVWILRLLKTRKDGVDIYR